MRSVLGILVLALALADCSAPPECKAGDSPSVMGIFGVFVCYLCATGRYFAVLWAVLVQEGFGLPLG